ncbi:MAG TPA: YceI family protein [Gemmatimonadales bacterium]
MTAPARVSFKRLLPAIGLVPASLGAQGHVRDSVIYDLATPPLSRLEVHASKSGLLGFAGHEHDVAARAFSGRIVMYSDQRTASHVSVTIPTDSLAVLTPPDTEEIRKVTQAMREEVLDVKDYPEITLASRTLAWSGDTVRMNAALTIKGRTREIPLLVRVVVKDDTLRATTTFSVKQSDFGIRPYRGGPGGTVRVADRVTFTIGAVALRHP